MMLRTQLGHRNGQNDLLRTNTMRSEPAGQEYAGATRRTWAIPMNLRKGDSSCSPAALPPFAGAAAWALFAGIARSLMGLVHGFWGSSDSCQAVKGACNVAKTRVYCLAGEAQMEAVLCCSAVTRDASLQVALG